MQVQSPSPLSKFVVVSIAVVAAVVGIINLKFKFYFKFFKFQIFSWMIIFQDKSYLQAVLVAVCIPLLCDNAIQYSEGRAAILVVVVVVVVVDFCRSELKIEKMVSEIKEENKTFTGNEMMNKTF